MMKCLVLEDDLELNETICSILNLDNYNITSFTDGDKALNSIENNRYDIYILDINVPNTSGLELLEYINNTSNNHKVLMISASTDIQTLTKAYDFGCCDYLKKPFYIDELRFKLENIHQTFFSLLKLNQNIYYDINKEQLFHNKEIVKLTKKELLLLNLFIENLNMIVTKDMIIEYLFDDKFTVDTNIRAILKRLRNKIGKNTVETISGIGYRINV